MCALRVLKHSMIRVSHQDPTHLTLMCVRARVNNANQTIGLKWSMISSENELFERIWIQNPDYQDLIPLRFGGLIQKKKKKSSFT